MVNIDKSPYDFIVRKIRTFVDTEGVSYIWEDEKNVEDDFPGIYVQSISGIRKKGKQKGVFAESFAESDMASVYVSSYEALDQYKIELSVYFFETSGKEGVESLNALRDSFEEYISGGMILFTDGMRKRKVLMYQSEEPDVFDEGLNGRLFMGVKYKFTSAYGRSFPIDDITIETDYAPREEEE